MDHANWIGWKTGKLAIIEYRGLRRFKGGGKASIFLFRCDCGREFEAQKSNVVGRRNSCGCDAKRPQYVLSKGISKHPLGKVFWAMHDRCSNPDNKSYQNYGGRGISVADRWTLGEDGLTGFECFVADMGERPLGATIERVDNDGPYSSDNCVWASRDAQAKNKRNVAKLTIDGQTRTIPEWCSITGVKYFTAKMRMRRGMPPEKAIQKQP